MQNLKDQFFESSEALFLAISNEFKKINIDIQSKVDHQYHFILDISSENKNCGRLSIYYNKKFKCTSVLIVHPLNPEHYELLSAILPFKKKNVVEQDSYIEYLNNNYHLRATKIYGTNTYSCYEISKDDSEVWLKIYNKEPLQCDYLKGDFTLFDYVQFIVEDEMSCFMRPKSLNL